MPGIAFPSWWSVEENDIFHVYAEYNTMRPDWKYIKKKINSDYHNIDSRFVSRYCSQYRGDPLLYSYAGLVRGILEKVESEPLIIFPPAAINSLDETVCSDKACELLEMLERSLEFDFRFLNDKSEIFRAYSDFSTDNFHPMLVEGVGAAIGTILTRYVASTISTDELLDICCYGDVLYARGIGNWAEELSEYFDEISETLIEIISGEEVDEIKHKLAKLEYNVPAETIEILSHSLNNLANIIEKKGYVRVSSGIYLVKNPTGGEKVSIKTKSEMNSEKLLKSAVSRLKRL